MALAPPTLRDPLCPLVRAVKLRGGTRLCVNASRPDPDENPFFFWTWPHFLSPTAGAAPDLRTTQRTEDSQDTGPNVKHSLTATTQKIPHAGSNLHRWKEEASKDVCVIIHTPYFSWWHNSARRVYTCTLANPSGTCKVAGRTSRVFIGSPASDSNQPWRC